LAGRVLQSRLTTRGEVDEARKKIRAISTKNQGKKTIKKGAKSPKKRRKSERWGVALCSEKHL